MDTFDNIQHDLSDAAFSVTTAIELDNGQPHPVLHELIGKLEDVKGRIDDAHQRVTEVRQHVTP